MSNQPLKPKIFYVLLALIDGPQHGYGIKKTVKSRSQGALDLDPGGLYRLIGRLEDDGLLSSCEAPPDADSADERRRYYELTGAGQRALQAEARRLSTVASWPEVRRLAREEPSS